MPFWTRRKTAKENTPATDTGKVQPARKKPGSFSEEKQSTPPTPSAGRREGYNNVA